MNGPRVLSAHVCLAVALLGSAAGARSLHGQEGQEVWIDAWVVEIAGTDFYVSAGTDAGLVTGSEYELRLVEQGTSPGRVRVLQAGAERSAVTFVGAPFPLTRGTHIALHTTDAAPIQPNDPDVAGGPVSRRPPPAATRQTGAEVHGSFGASFETRESKTEWDEFRLEPVERTFTTPSTWLNLRVSRLPAGLNFRLHARASQRNSNDDLIQPDGLVRVYSAQVTGSAGILDFAVGRGYNPFDASSGYFDGVYVHAGRSLGAGVSAGFEPDRTNSGVSTDVPKVSVFGDFTHRRNSVRSSAVGSLTSVRPSAETGRVDRTYATLRQSLRVNRVRLGQSLQLDRDASASTWSVSRLLLDATADLGRGLSVRGTYSRRKPSTDLFGAEFQPYTRDLGRIGFVYSTGRTSASLDFGIHDTSAQEAAGHNVAGSMRVSSRSGFGFDLSGSYWNDDRSSALTLRPGLNRRFGAVLARAWYTFYRSNEPEANTHTHTASASLSAPLSPRVRADISGRLQRGSILTGSRVYASIRWAF